MKNVFLQVLALIMAISLKAQNAQTGCPKVLFVSKDVLDPFCDTTVKSVSRAFLSENVRVKYRDKNTQFIPDDSIWGFRRRNQYPERWFDGKYYTLYKVAPVFKYSRTVGKYSHYYFSVTLDSPIYPYDRTELKRRLDSVTYETIVRQAEINRREMAIDLFVMNSRVDRQNVWGGGLEIKYYPLRKWGTGLYLSGLSGRTTDTFSFSIKKPSLSGYEVGWINQYDVFQGENFRIGINLLNGFASFVLTDKSQKEKIQGRYGSRYAAKTMASNYYYLIEPGADFSFKVFSNKHYPDIFLTVKMKYRFLIGDSEFGSNSIFYGYGVSAGISVIGFDQ